MLPLPQKEKLANIIKKRGKKSLKLLKTFGENNYSVGKPRKEILIRALLYSLITVLKYDPNNAHLPH